MTIHTVKCPLPHEVNARCEIVPLEGCPLCKGAGSVAYELPGDTPPVVRVSVSADFRHVPPLAIGHEDDLEPKD